MVNATINVRVREIGIRWNPETESYDTFGDVEVV